MTYREFAMLCEENIERTHDIHEREAMYAIMHAAASRGKGKKGELPEMSDLYKRPSDVDKDVDKAKDAIEMQQYTNEWLSQFDLSKLTE